jgi:hypothetical protein
MLTDEDVAFIRANRAEITEHRIVPVTLTHVTETGADPYTDEPITETDTEQVDVTWSEYSTVANGDRSVIGGVELRQDDVKVAFDIAVNLSDVETLTKDGEKYVIVTIDNRGLGGDNRQECVVRRVV